MQSLINRSGDPDITIQPEFELLICSARTCIEADTAQRIQALVQQNIDWGSLIQLAQKHGVLPLLYRTMNQICVDSVPVPILQKLKQAYQANATRNLLLMRELLKILEILDSHGISAVPFKGPILATQVYGDIALRRFGDLDILVRQEEYVQAKEPLLAYGYRADWEPWCLSPAQEADFLWEQGEYSLISKNKEVFVDLHGRLISGYLFNLSTDLNFVWDHLERSHLAGQPVLTFRPEDLLLYLCVHGAKSLWLRFSWICDIAELVRAYSTLNWDDVLATAKKSGTQRMLLLGLLLAEDVLGARLPETVSQQARADRVCQALAKQVYQRLLGQIEPLPEKFSLEKFLFHIRVMEQQQDRVKYIARVLAQYSIVPIWKILRPTANDQKFLPLPEFLHFFYYFIKPLRLLIQLLVAPKQLHQKLD